MFEGIDLTKPYPGLIRDYLHQEMATYSQLPKLRKEVERRSAEYWLPLFAVIQELWNMGYRPINDRHMLCFRGELRPFVEWVIRYELHHTRFQRENPWLPVLVLGSKHLKRMHWVGFSTFIDLIELLYEVPDEDLPLYLSGNPEKPWLEAIARARIEGRTPISITSPLTVDKGLPTQRKRRSADEICSLHESRSRNVNPKMFPGMPYRGRISDYACRQLRIERKQRSLRKWSIACELCLLLACLVAPEAWWLKTLLLSCVGSLSALWNKTLHERQVRGMRILNLVWRYPLTYIMGQSEKLKPGSEMLRFRNDGKTWVVDFTKRQTVSVKVLMPLVEATFEQPNDA